MEQINMKEEVLSPEVIIKPKRKYVKKAKVTELTIIEKQKRCILVEGRNNGMAFGFLKRISDLEYNTVQPLSPCKDFLNEVVLTENTGIPTKMHGLDYKAKLNIFGDINYMAIKLLPSKGGYYPYGKSIDHDNELLSNNYPIMQKILNEFEEILNLDVKTKIEKANDSCYLVSFSKEWCKSTHGISLYTLLLRVLMPATEEKDMLTYLKEYTYNYGDVGMIGNIIYRIEKIIKQKALPPNRIPYNIDALKKKLQSPHNNGIQSWDGEFEEIEIK